MTGSRDPTRSAGLRRQGRGLVTHRVFELHRDLRTSLQEHDAAGLRMHESVPAVFHSFVEPPSQRLARSEQVLSQIVDHRIARPVDWVSEILDRAVWKGLEQVGQELRVAVDGLDPTEVSRFLGNAASIEVQGIAAETQRRVMRHVVNAVDMQATPEELLRNIRATLEKITRLRLHLLINTGVVRAVNAGKLFGYEYNGIKRVGIQPEWVPNLTHFHDRETREARQRRRGHKQRREAKSPRTQQRREQAERRLEAAFEGLAVGVLTAEDDKVCDECEQIASEGPYDLDEARDLIPAHPNCRCAFVPFDVEE